MLGGALLFGAGLGLLMSSTLILTMDRVGEGERGLGSTLWNVSFDAGTGAGAFLFGFLVGASGFAPAFYLSSVLLLAALALVALDRPRHRGAADARDPELTRPRQNRTAQKNSDRERRGP